MLLDKIDSECPAEALNAQGVSAFYGDRQVLRDISLTVHKDELVAVLGPNGSGKSTMLKAFVKLVDMKGSVNILNRSVEKLSRRELARMVSYMPQKGHMAMPFKVLDVVLLGRYPWVSFLGNYGTFDVKLALRYLQEVEMKGFEERLVTSLSGGELQRVLLAQCLAQDAALLLLDEPTSALDPKHSVAVMRVLRAYVNAGRAALCVMHDVNLALRFADKIALMKDGSVYNICDAKDVDADMLSEVFDVSWYVKHWDGGLIAIPL
ncbi:MAG TPA: ABC transporter ATP-binding protein [Acetomicrobium hydrogeniformans]|uniref:ABC transporter ATP-binding protein n=1 Tax=Acetomicrobium hydrogeniformans TaxID=649746 RepID=A0A7V6ZEP4_9BACT|nr:ABC transporter ATP-binding protein [Acetomicrobium hydrogeniformans]